MRVMLGASLAELMVGLLLSSFLIITLMQLHLYTKSQFFKTKAALNEAFDLSWVSLLLRDHIARAGFTPCGRVEHLQTTGPTLRGLLIKREGLFIARMEDDFKEIKKVVDPYHLSLFPLGKVHARFPVLITDCQKAELRHIHYEGAYAVLDKPLAFQYQKPLYMGNWMEALWFIKKNKTGTPALFLAINGVTQLSNKIHTLVAQVHNQGLYQKVEVHLGLEGTRSLDLVITAQNA